MYDGGEDPMGAPVGAILGVDNLNRLGWPTADWGEGLPVLEVLWVKVGASGVIISEFNYLKNKLLCSS